MQPKWYLPTAPNTALLVKEYFYHLVAGYKFSIYSVTLNKVRVYENLSKKKNHIYNYLARLVIDEIPLEKADTRIELIIDKSKGKPEVENFNNYIVGNVQSRIDPKVPLDIHHFSSTNSPGLQIVDLFCWGIFRKYERDDTEWYSYFKDKIKLDKLYLSHKK